ncbi:MAG TPA: 4Fe-4S dicluster domain-containing protein [Desulfotomaculum sp.]|nr:4Fe-4S dicluster domain-containing protein [Desulfotomaculum sp.]
MAKVFFDKERCKGCELCITACPKKIIVLSQEVNSLGLHPAVLTDGSKCTGCGFCFLVCPDLVVTVSREENSNG